MGLVTFTAVFGRPSAALSCVVTIDPDLLAALPAGVYVAEKASLDAMMLFARAAERVLAVDRGLDLSTIVRIYAHERYADALAALSRDVGRTVAATNNAEGQGIGIVHHEADGEYFTISLGVLLSVFSPADEVRGFALNVLHHELCHIHDAATHRRNLPGFYPVPAGLKGWEQRLFPFAHDIWSEYFANRRAHRTSAGGVDIHRAPLEEAVLRFPNVVRDCVTSLEDEDDVTTALDKAVPLFLEVCPPLESLCKHLGYVMGTRAALRDETGDSPTLTFVSQQSWLQESWTALEKHLDQIYRTHGQWPGLEVYLPVVNEVRSMLARAGMTLTYFAGRLLMMPT